MCIFFLFKQKTAYEMRISDWSSDVCSSDLRCDVELMKSLYWEDAVDNHGVFNGGAAAFAEYIVGDTKQRFESTVHALGNMLIEVEGDVAHSESYLIANCVLKGDRAKEIGRASCRERVCQSV